MVCRWDEDIVANYQQPIHRGPLDRNYDLHFNIPGGVVEVRTSAAIPRGCVGLLTRRPGPPPGHVARPFCAAPSTVKVLAAAWLRRLRYPPFPWWRWQDHPSVSCSAMLAVLSLFFHRHVPRHIVMAAECRPSGEIEPPPGPCAVPNDTMLQLAKLNRVRRQGRLTCLMSLWPPSESADSSA